MDRDKPMPRCGHCAYDLAGIAPDDSAYECSCPECGVTSTVERLLPERSRVETCWILLWPGAIVGPLAIFATAAESYLAGLIAFIGMALSVVWAFAAVDCVLHGRVPARAYPRRAPLLLLVGWLGTVVIFVLSLILGGVIGRL